MKRLMLQVAVMILTFAFGVGLDRVISGRHVDRDPQVQKLQPVTVSIVEPHNELIAPPAPFATPTPNLIFDYDPEKFVPDGAYYIMGLKPKEFLEFDRLELGLAEIVDGRLSGYLGVQTNSNNRYDYQFANFGLVAERRVFFVTSQPSEAGFEYRFDGEFLRGKLQAVAGKDTAVLRGTLTKTKEGRKVAESVVNFPLSFMGVSVQEGEYEFGGSVPKF